MRIVLMRVAAWLVFASLLLSNGAIAAVPKDAERPDKEMLQMMELLKNMEMIKQIDLMQDMQNVDSSGGTTADTGAQKSQVVKKREGAK
jgi:hypothetical protein